MLGGKYIGHVPDGTHLGGQSPLFAELEPDGLVGGCGGGRHGSRGGLEVEGALLLVLLLDGPPHHVLVGPDGDEGLRRRRTTLATWLLLLLLLLMVNFPAEIRVLRLEVEGRGLGRLAADGEGVRQTEGVQGHHVVAAAAASLGHRVLATTKEFLKKGLDWALFGHAGSRGFSPVRLSGWRRGGGR